MNLKSFIPLFTIIQFLLAPQFVLALEVKSTQTEGQAVVTATSSVPFQRWSTYFKKAIRTDSFKALSSDLKSIEWVNANEVKMTFKTETDTPPLYFKVASMDRPLEWSLNLNGPHKVDPRGFEDKMKFELIKDSFQISLRASPLKSQKSNQTKVEISLKPESSTTLKVFKSLSSNPLFEGMPTLSDLYQKFIRESEKGIHKIEKQL